MDQSQRILTDDHPQVNDDPIDDILSGRFKIPETGKRLKSVTQCIVIEADLSGSECDVIEALGCPSSLAIICDANTYDVLGQRVAKALTDAVVVVLDAPKADETTAEHLLDQTRHADGLIAVGAGTLNDVVKYVSHQRQQPYAVFATAPSMNGYVTTTASISRHGEKLSLPATPPVGAFFDLGIVAKAPRRLIQAGVGDSLCRSTAECDWWLSHLLFENEFLETPFSIQKHDETRLLERVEDLESGDLEAIKSLVRLLILGGFGMVIAGNSQPGSQGEHLISHYIDMLHKPDSGSLHGEQVGLATRTMAALQHDVISRASPPVLKALSINSDEMAKRFGRWCHSCKAALTAKALSGDGLDALNERIASNWPIIQATYGARSLPLNTIEGAFDKAGVASVPEELDISCSFYREAILHARELRDRFTMLDLAAHADILAPFIDHHVGRPDRP